MFLTEIYLKLFWLKKTIQAMDSTPWVRCVSGNVSSKQHVSNKFFEKILMLFQRHGLIAQQFMVKVLTNYKILLPNVMAKSSWGMYCDKKETLDKYCPTMDIKV